LGSNLDYYIKRYHPLGPAYNQCEGGTETG
jgi:hypothetical protein